MEVNASKSSASTPRRTRSRTYETYKLEAEPDRPGAGPAGTGQGLPGRHAVLPPLVRARHLRLGRHAHQRAQPPGLQDAGAGYRATKITVEPLLGLPVIKDLIVDMEPFFEHYRSVMPYLINDEPPNRTRNACKAPSSARASTTPPSASCAPACTTSCPSFWANEQVCRPGGHRQRAPLHLRQPRPGRRGAPARS